MKQAVGDPVEVVYPLDVLARLCTDAAALRGRVDQRLEARPEVGFRGADDRDALAELFLRAVDGLVVQERTTGFPSAMHSIAKRPYQPAFSWSTTMSASR